MALNSINDVINSLERIGCCPLTGAMTNGGMLLLAGIFDARGGYDQRKVALLPNSIDIHSNEMLVAYLAADGLSYEIRSTSKLSNLVIADIASGAQRIVVSTTAYRAAAGTPAAQVNSEAVMYFNGGIIGNNLAKVIKFFDPQLSTRTDILRVDSGKSTIHHLADVFVSALYRSGFTVDGKANRI